MSYRNLLARATEGTDAPTPGYIYVDLAKQCTSNPTACQEMAQYLYRRLASKQNPNIKYKCVKVMSKLCDNVPRNAFRRCIAQDHIAMSAIKESMHFRGVPDPVRGDEPNQKVRDAAKECLDAVYRESIDAPTTANSSLSGGGGGGYGGISSNYGNTPGGGGGGMPGGGGGRMQGIGNPMFSDPRQDPRYNGEYPAGQSAFKHAVLEAGKVVGEMIKDPLARNVGDPHQQHNVPRQGHSGNLPGYGGPTPYGARPPPGSAELSRQTGGQWTMASNRGPGAVTPEYQREQPPPQQQHQQHHTHASTGAVGGSWGSVPTAQPPQQQLQQHNSMTPRVTINSVPGMSGGGGGTAVSDGTYEKNLVNELCPPGGMKPVPPPDKLANFARACSSLNSDLVCPALLDCLEEGQPWIIRAKALCAMETAIANGGKADGTNPYSDFFHACQEEIAPLAAHPRSAIHEPAKRVLALLGVAPGDMPAVAATASAPVAAAPPNLLDFGDEEPSSSSQPPAPPSQAPPPPPSPAGTGVAAGGGTMFGGMQVKSTAASPVAQPPVAAPPVSAAPAPNLLDFDAAGTAAAPNSQQPSSDIFRGSTEEKKTSSMEPVVTATSSMFDQLSMKGSEDKAGKDNEIKAVATNGSQSAFGFMHDGSSKDEPSSASAPPTFDPLKDPTHHTPSSPTSAQKRTPAMSMSPEQMQAMAYQQMMMQQQYQQMQMQMAMQQKMGGVGAHPGGGVPMYPALGNVRRTPSSGSAGGGMPQQQFSFQAKPAKKDDKKFDFVKDAMSTASHKK